MIGHDVASDICPHCHGTGQASNVARGIARSWPCACPAGRSLAMPAAPALRVVSTRERRRA